MNTREEFNDLARIYLPVAIAVAVIVFGLVGFALIRYRRRDERLPKQREGMTRVETSYAVVLALIAATLLFFSFRATDDIAALDDDPGLRVNVTAFQWNWRFTYPDDGVTVIGTDDRQATLMVPSDTTVRFTLTSRDVIHAFWIPEERFKRDAFPNRETEFDLTFDQDGESTGRCAEFCGLSHDLMTFDVVVMEPAEFEDWLRTQREGLMEAHAEARGTMAEPAPDSGLLAWIATTDHKRIALRMASVALVFFLVAGVFALLIRTQLIAPGGVIFEQDAYNQVFTMHGSTMIYLVVMPLALALGVYLVPLQIGAADIAAPRLTLAGHWLMLAGGLTMYSSFLTDHGAGKAGWTAYYPLSGSSATPGTGMDLWIFGVILVGIGATVIAGTILATVLRLRAPGMTMMRIPVFTWTIVASCLLILMSVPVLGVGMALLFAERELGGIFDSSGGPIAYQNLFWFFGHPAVYIMFFPFLGITAEVVATFCRKKFFGYKAMILAVLAFTGLSMSVWAHHMFTTGQVANKYFALTSTALIVPAGIEYFDIIATMIGASIVLRAPMLFGLGFFLQFLIGGLSGVFTAAPALDYHVHDSYFVVGHFHYTLFAGSMFAGFAAVYFWFPKWTGAMLRDGLGKLHFGLMFIGTNLTFFPMFLLGVDGMPRRIASYTAEDGFQGLNLVASIGSYFIAASVAVFLINLFISLRNRIPAGDDPWEGHTLEWTTTSPPPRFNFRKLPPIRSYAPAFDLRHGLNQDDQGSGGSK